MPALTNKLIAPPNPCMEGLEERAVGLTEYMPSVPSATRSAMLLIALGFLFGIMLAMVKGATDGFALLEYAGAGIFLISIPAFLSAITCIAAKRVLNFRRMLFLALVCAVLYAAFYLASVALGGVYAQSANFILIGYGLSFILWYAIAKLAFQLKYSAFLFAILQLAYNAIFFSASKVIGLGSDVFAVTLKFYVVSGIFLLALYAIFWLVNAPIRRNFGISGIDALSLFLAQWISSSSDIEEMFESVGQEVETTVGVVVFEGRKGGKTAFVVPNVHFGPIGNLGGSEFPRLIANMMEAKHGARTFVFHGTATHDFNPVSSKEVENVWEACGKALGKVRLLPARGGFAVGKSGNSRAHCLRINDAAFVGLTRAPRTTEDVDFSVGMAIGERLRSLGAKVPIVCDAHNAELGEIMKIESGNPIGFEYMEAAGEALGKAQGRNALKMGTASEQFEGFREAGIGANGLRCAAFDFGGGKKYLLMLFDANGITPSFRRDLIGIAEKKTGYKCELYTTDTHSINMVRGVLNPIGEKRAEEIRGLALAAAEKAAEAVEPVRAGAAVERFGIKVIGPRQSSEFVGTVNSIVAIAKIAVPVMLIGTVLLVLWAATKI